MVTVRTVLSATHRDCTFDAETRRHGGHNFPAEFAPEIQCRNDRSGIGHVTRGQEAAEKAGFRPRESPFILPPRLCVSASRTRSRGGLYPPDLLQRLLEISVEADRPIVHVDHRG